MNFSSFIPNDLSDFEQNSVLSQKDKFILFDQFNQDFITELSVGPGVDIKDMRTLGRVLFYEKNLSKDKTISCASCHKQSFAFSDNTPFSIGIDNQKTDRNAPALLSFENFESSYNAPVFDKDSKFFWDERAASLEEQMAQTISNPKEMGLSLEEAKKRLESLDYIAIFYKIAFHTDEIEMDKVLEAISHFVNSFSTGDSPFDVGFGDGVSVKIEEDFFNYSDVENLGKDLFIQNCGSCHAFSLSNSLAEEFNIDRSSANNGLDKIYADKGIGSITSSSLDNGLFKIPGLRNIELTAPYMHDGRFETLEGVIEFYSTGIQPHENLDSRLKDDYGKPKRHNFSEAEKMALTAFLKTLSDKTIAKERKWANPFKSNDSMTN